MSHPLDDLPTPSLLLDQRRFERNLARMREHLAPFGVTFRPHLKTPKSIDAARRAIERPDGPAMVSTLEEAEYFAGHGIRDLTYGVGIAPRKLDRIGRIRRQHGADLAILLDSLEQAEAVAAWCEAEAHPLPVLIEIDADGHRAGVKPEHATTLLAIGRSLQQGGAVLRGVLCHAGGSYALSRPEDLRAAAAAERQAAVSAAEILRAAGLPCPVVSIGSTPTALFATDLAGVTEVRAGVYMFGDLVQAGIGSCAVDDIVLSVLTSVIGRQRDKGWTIVDAGWMALSRDRGTAGQATDQGYGLACDLAGRPYPDLLVTEANQEHGIVAVRSGSTAAAPELPLGTLLRILPNHACATAAQHDRYHVLDPDGTVIAEWPRFGGW